MSSGSDAQKVFEAGLVLDDDCGAFDLQELLLLEITKQPSHGLSRCPDHLGDFFVREGEREPYVALSIVMICGEIQQEAGQLLTRGVRESNGSHFCDRRMIGFTELLRYAQCRLAVLA